ncbi:carboxylesterase family protein [Nonomuraea zeae]|uniref:carboxylesterase family protein n=1 Tax=Nonomuraea zeae TaxID=1642303 RepID=UPI001F118D69|nr:carboxylesterase family protein [Nonomuraea zeae]
MPEQPKVRTTEGVVQGRRRQGHAVFRGIPYAQPPVGALRFAAPAPPHRWEGTRQAVEFGPVVPLSLPIDVPPQGTDWLTLNVGTPDPGAAGLPVLVWIPVGGYLSAASSDPMFDPAALAEAGLVVVTINCPGHRVEDSALPRTGIPPDLARPLPRPLRSLVIVRVGSSDCNAATHLPVGATSRAGRGRRERAQVTDDPGQGPDGLALRLPSPRWSSPTTGPSERVPIHGVRSRSRQPVRSGP